MPTRYSTSNGTLSDTQSGSEPKFPIYFCEICGFRGAAFNVRRADGQLSYCGWVNNEPGCVGKGKSEGQAIKAAPGAPWE